MPPLSAAAAAVAAAAAAVAAALALALWLLLLLLLLLVVLMVLGRLRGASSKPATRCMSAERASIIAVVCSLGQLLLLFCLVLARAVRVQSGNTTRMKLDITKS